jgi:hypothetical protein
LEKVSRGQVTELTAEEALGLECVLLLYGRPAVLVSHGRLGTVPPFWSVLEDQRPDIDMVQRGVGRIELFGHPEYEWAGTGFLASDTCLIATRRTAEAFMENRGGQWQFRPGISAWMDYRSEYQGVAGAGYRVRAVIGVHEHYDLALLEVEPPQGNGTAPAPLALAAEPPRPMEGRQVYMIGYPVRDARRDEPELISRIFRDTYNVKRVQPGVIRGTFRFNEVQLLQHDCGPLGQNAGACIVDLETHQAVGINLYGRYMETSTAIPLWVLREDPLVRRAGLTFAEATTQQLEQTTAQVERLARSRYWAEVRDYIAGVYQRAYGY